MPDAPSPDTVFAELAAAIGARLFTVTTHDPEAQLFRRAYTSHPAEYPVSGTKPMARDAWGDQVIGRHESFVANTTAGFSGLFPDHALINALGCHSVINVPVLRGDGEVAGTVNALDAEGWFTPGRVARIEALVAERNAALVPAMMAAAQDRS